jgi:hypothetical protein
VVLKDGQDNDEVSLAHSGGVSSQAGQAYSCKVLIQDSTRKLNPLKLKPHDAKILLQPAAAPLPPPPSCTSTPLSEYRSSRRCSSLRRRRRSLPSVVSYPGILPLLAHNERTQREMMERLPMLHVATTTTTTTTTTTPKTTTTQTTQKKQPLLISCAKRRNEIDPENAPHCGMCEKSFSCSSSLHEHNERGHCSVCKRALLLQHHHRRRPSAKTSDGRNSLQCHRILRRCRNAAAAPKAAHVCARCTKKLRALGVDRQLISTHHRKMVGGAENKRTREDCIQCDICAKFFRRRVQMIKHVMSHHASQMHQVELSKFVGSTKEGAVAAAGVGRPW